MKCCVVKVNNLETTALKHQFCIEFMQISKKFIKSIVCNQIVNVSYDSKIILLINIRAQRMVNEMIDKEILNNKKNAQMHRSEIKQCKNTLQEGDCE